MKRYETHFPRQELLLTKAWLLGLVTTKQVALLVGVKPSAVSYWAGTRARAAHAADIWTPSLKGER